MVSSSGGLVRWLAYGAVNTWLCCFVVSTLSSHAGWLHAGGSHHRAVRGRQLVPHLAPSWRLWLAMVCPSLGLAWQSRGPAGLRICIKHVRACTSTSSSTG